MTLLLFDSRDNCNAVIETASNKLIIGCINSTIPYSVTSIGESAFSGCEALTSIEIHNALNSIGNMAFSYTGLVFITNKASYPQDITKEMMVFDGVNIQHATLYVPAESIELYRIAEVWKEFNILPIESGSQKNDVVIYYTDKDNQALDHEQIMLHLPEPPFIEGFVFLEWMVVAGHLNEGIIVQAVYEASCPTEAPAVYTNPSDHSQKLVRNGNVYILRSDEIYTITGTKVR